MPTQVVLTFTIPELREYLKRYEYFDHPVWNIRKQRLEFLFAKVLNNLSLVYCDINFAEFPLPENCDEDVALRVAVEDQFVVSFVWRYTVGLSYQLNYEGWEFRLSDDTTAWLKVNV